MKKILLLSDTHHYLDDAILHHAEQADEIWHAGDIGKIEVADRLSKIKPLRAVYGNIDDAQVRVTFPEHLRFTVEGLSVWMTHIGGYPGHYAPPIRKMLQENTPGLFICGHSHILRVMRDPKFGMLTMNPGAAGIHGFHQVRTMLRFTISEGKVTALDAIELGLRGALP